MERNCSFDGCTDKYYAKGFCSAHYEQHRKGLSLKPLQFKNRGKKCLASGCERIARAMGFCQKHYGRFKKHGNTETVLPAGRVGSKGARNGNWRGGTMEYPNHYLMKQIRKEKIKNAKCKDCGGTEKLEMHHIDLTKNNHDLSNLEFLCHKCHANLHQRIKDALDKLS